MGVPTTANYVITSTIAAPALVQMNVPVLAAHMFAFYFGIVADVTPPVALAAYAGSGIAGANPMKTGVNAAKLAIAAFIVPYIFVLAPELLMYIFVLAPELLMINATAVTVLLSMITAILGMWGLSLAMIGFCQHPLNILQRIVFFLGGLCGFCQHPLNILQRIVFFLGGLCLIVPGATTDIAGVAVLVLAFLWQKRNKGGALTATGEDD